MDENSSNVSQPFITTMCWEMGSQDCILPTVGAIVRLCVANIPIYGIYLVLFAVCISVLRRRQRERFHFHSLLVIALFVLVTCSSALDTAATILAVYGTRISGSIPLVKYERLVGPVWPPESILEKLVGPQGPRPDDMLSRVNMLYSCAKKLGLAWQITLVTSNLVTDIILIWRCYVIWGSRRRVVALPGLLCLVNNVAGYLTIVPKKGPWTPVSQLDFGILYNHGYHESDLSFKVLALGAFCGILFSNLLLTVLIAGRVLYISRQLSLINSRPITRMYRTIIHASIESGVLYPIAVFAYTVMGYESSSWGLLSVTAEVLRCCLSPIMGIASTLIIVRVALGIASNDEIPFRKTALGEDDGENGKLEG
ncbi:hypothetical protein PM082_022241 [Marasmius tenuissimus]|nr:hypothetical protein PM082_022241 [Marasmius tenuissimus]